MTFRHRAGVRPYTSPCGFAESCVFDKQSLGPFRCGPPGLRRLAPSPGRAPLLPKLRGRYAEFLNHGSPDRLGMLYPPTCVGFGTGAAGLPRGFSRGHGLAGFGSDPSSRVSGSSVGWFPCRPPYALSRGRPEPRPATLPRHPVGGDGPRRYRNVRLLCIAYACPPRLSSRLTLGRLALPRNP